jgi:hypothetical protein
MEDKNLMQFLSFLDSTGLLSIPMDKHDYEKEIWNFQNQSLECCLIPSTDWYGKCFKCGKQIFTRKEK